MTQWIAAQDVAQVAAELAGPVAYAVPITSSVVGLVDVPLPNSLQFEGRFQVIAQSESCM